MHQPVNRVAGLVMHEIFGAQCGDGHKAIGATVVEGHEQARRNELRDRIVKSVIAVGIAFGLLDGGEPGDRVLMMAPNSADVIITWYGSSLMRMW